LTKQHTCPLIIEGKPQEYNVKKLEKVTLGLGDNNKKDKLYDEDWIQNLIHNNPSILPVEELESAFFPLYPVCRELKTPAGFLDNLFVSENGSLTLVECKLWRNPEARREVVGQALDYAKEFANWSYEDLSTAIRETIKEKGNFLYDVVAKENPDLDEAEFVDSVSRNLSRGRFLILIVGDGIREGVENISNFLQKHAGLDFTFGLVELGFFKVPEVEQYIIQPRILARTFTIERSVIRTDGLNIKVETPEDKFVTHKISGHKTSISEEQFFDLMSSNYPSVKHELLPFIESLAEYGIVAIYGKSSLSLRWFTENNLKMSFGTINDTGLVDTGYANYLPAKLGKVEIGHNYLRNLARIIPRAVVNENKTEKEWNLKKEGRFISIMDLLAVKNEWKEIMRHTQSEILEALNL